ncbi:MAG: hypothetical protein PHZ02_11790 [Desulfocapsaceae bacterium]|nr:hypothetical protein [Desulfocapsaceae bacterium]
MEQKKIVRKRSAGPKKRKRNWLNARRLIPFLLLLFLLLFSMAAAGYVIFFRAVPTQVAALSSVAQAGE